ncbi:sterile alpha motif domain-containing protein 9-like isoform X2 [Carassius gibelio]|nr:sterile alpha motif domain-containing protein 9-like isoform X2 [Carassius gibelio]
MEQSEPSEKHLECSEHNKSSLKNMNDWTTDDVCEWLVKRNVPEQYAKLLYSKDVYGASLIHFNKQDLLDLGLMHGPAVHITKIVAEFQTSSQNIKHSAILKDTDASVETSVAQGFQQAAEIPAIGSAEMETPAQISIEENRSDISRVQRWSFAKGDKASGAQSLALPLTQCTIQANNIGSETKAHLIVSKNPEEISVSSELQYCAPRPFDKRSESFEYIQNDILPPETGPSNLIDPLHEYKLMANTENASEVNVFKKFRNETFRFAAACMNTRTNGTIHFGVGDEPLYKHGQIIGLEVPSRDKYVDEFDKGLQEHFKGKSNIAMACIRPPKFVKVKCPDSKDKWVIEIDVVPKYKLTQKKLFYTTLDKKKKKSRCLFIRSGASTINYLPENNLKIFKQNSKNLKNDLELWALARQLAEEDITSIRMCFHQCICSRDQCQWCLNPKVVHQP